MTPKWNSGDYMVAAVTLFTLTILVLTVIGNLQ